MNSKNNRRVFLSFLLFLCGLPFLTTGALAQASKEAIPEYRLAPGDSIHIQVFQNPDLTLDTRVSETGDITFPLVGAVPVGGRSLGEAEQAIAKKLEQGKFVVKPQVSVMLTQNRGNQVSVLGQVKNPGRVPLDTANTRLSAAIAAAGGITEIGSDRVVLSGLRDGKPYRREVEISTMFSGTSKGGEDVVLNGGDVIFVPKAPMFYIYGEVQHPGSYRQERNMDIRQALAQGGGLTPRGTERGVRIQRRGADGQVVEIRPKLNDLVQADDVIQVPESLF